MTSLLHKKPRTTAPRRRAATACKLALLALAFAGGSAAAQYPARQPSPSPSAAGKVMQFHKPADAAVAVNGPGVSVVPAAAQQPDKDKEKPPEFKKPLEKDDRLKYGTLPRRDEVFAFPDDVPSFQATNPATERTPVAPNNSSRSNSATI